MKKFKLKYKVKVDNAETTQSKYEFFRTYHFCYKKFKKIIGDNNTLCAFVDKWDKDTKKYSEPVNSYRLYEKQYLRVR